MTKMVIDGVAYDTETATFIAMGEADPDGIVGSQASWSLYKTRLGSFFEVVCGHDGVVEAVHPFTDKQARRFLEVNANNLVEEHFGPILEPRPSRFSRLTVIAAIQTMRPFNHAELKLYLLKLGGDVARKVGDNGYIADRLNRLIVLALDELPPNCSVEDGVLQDVLVEDAVARLPGFGYDPENPGEYLLPLAAEFLRGLERDGYTVSGALLRRTLPVDIGLAAAQSEIDRLLEKHRFTIPKGQLGQAIDAHARGNWADANGQFRPFLEGLLDEIAARLARSPSEPLRGHGARAKLGALGFLRRDLNEWDDDGRGFINGLIKRLHPEGPHPGLSGEDDSTFRLHVALLTAHLLLARFDTWRTP
jgi:hypothetical protein